MDQAAAATPSPPIVALEALDNYEPQQVQRALEQLWRHLGPLEQFVAGKKVLLKPNFLSANPPQKAVNTHPEIIRAIAAAAIEAGAKRVVVADSPAMGSAKRVARKLGLYEKLAPLGVEIEDFSSAVEINIAGARYPRFQIARQVVEADVVLNLAKLKTHGLCGLTMAVKNCFGTVIGIDKARWHMRAGRDLQSFAALLVQICKTVAPQLSIVDAVLAMDGNGPGSGRPRKAGFLAAATDPFVLDRVLAKICKVNPEQVLTFAQDGLQEPLEITIHGQPIENLVLDDWQMPGASGGVIGIMGRVLAPLNFIRQRLAPTPRFRHRLCNSCGQCVDICPAQALESISGKIKIDKNACIRCFCCQEICPQGAIQIKRK